MEDKPQRKSIDAERRDGSFCSSDDTSVMEVERRGRPIQSHWSGQPENGRSHCKKTKPYQISKHLVVEAYKRVKANKGSAGVDGQSLKDFETKLKGNLYKIWNRMSSGSYCPPAVLRVEIPKAGGGVRGLGIPTVADRIAQMVVKLQIEPELERHFHPDSYDYRPNKSAHDALKMTKARCQKKAWVLDMDIKGFFDEIDHERLLLCVERHVKEPWQILYIKRWLTAPVAYADGRVEPREKGTPQGGVILIGLFIGI